jgi:hypothetical protein
MDFEIEIVSTQQSYEIELKWSYKTILQLLLDFVNAW